ncbi:hypothetical protein C1M55_31460 (plasmid) [Rhodococcus qingshengii]|uniref:hypothetical protein n=1 Tax=Rhodococcus qingshengii TaxID=334542 RepID=UPI000C9F477C|nr:hypothetical protein [Rhodococcus qingshengii]AUS35775.1 hypothetical protein C1M55_31460 [Rhodococcus qingshengii]
MTGKTSRTTLLLALVTPLVITAVMGMTSIYAARAAAAFVPPPQCFTQPMLGSTSYCTSAMRTLSWAAGAGAVLGLVAFLAAVLVVVVERSATSDLNVGVGREMK